VNPLLDKSVVSTTFIGRAAQLTVLTNRLLHAEQGNNQLPLQVVLVTGEAGIGKSRLVAEARHRADQRGWQIVEGRAFEPDRVFPYAPFIDLLRTRLARSPVNEWLGLLGPLAGELAKLLPELTSIIPDLAPAPLDPEAEKRRLFEAVVQFFNRIIAGEEREATNPSSLNRPLLLIVENLHWSDETSLELLRYLARRLATQPLMLLFTYRSDEVHPILQQFLAGLSREQHSIELTLPRFTPDEVDALLRAIFEQERPIRTEFLDALMNLTGGNPFFIEEVLKALIINGDLFYHDDAWDRKPIEELQIPLSIQDAVQRRVAQLSADTHRTLTLAAVAGRHFDFGVLQAVTGCSETDLLRQIKELLAAQLVVEVSTDRFAFRHALTQKTIYEQLLIRERQMLHRQIGETIEGQVRNKAIAPTASLAYHFYAADAWEKALIYARRAGAETQALFTPHATIEQFTRALEAAQHLNEMTAQPDLYRARGLAYETVGDFISARDDLEIGLQVACNVMDRPMEWRALMDLGKLWTARDYTRAGDYFQRALDLARALDDPELLARTLNQIGNWHLNAEALHQALVYHEEALAIFQELKDEAGIAQTFDLLGMTNLLGGNVVLGAAYCQQAIDLFTVLDDRQRLSSSLTTLSLCGPVYTTDTVVAATMSLVEGIRYGKQAVQVAHEIGWRAGEAYSLTQVGQSFAVHGQYGEAIAFMQRGLALAQEIDHHQWICLIHRELGRLYFYILALSTAHQHLAHSLVLAQEIGSSFHIRRTKGCMASLLIAECQFPEAEALLNTIGDLDLPMQTLSQRLTWQGWVELALTKGDSAEALRIVNQLFAATTDHENQNIGAIPYLALLRGNALTALRRWSAAEDALLAALVTAQSRGTPRVIWRSHVALGQLYQAQALQAKAEQAFAAASVVIDKIAVTIPDSVIRDNFIQQTQAMMTPPTPSTPLQTAKLAHGGLTRREHEVAALVVEGKTNREIAAMLVIGVRTVEGYVSNILNKLGFSSRTQIAAWMVEQGLRTDSK